MKIKLKKNVEQKPEAQTKTVKNSESEVELNSEENLDLQKLHTDKNLQEITEFELTSLLHRLKFLSKDLGLVPVIDRIIIRYEPQKSE